MDPRVHSGPVGLAAWVGWTLDCVHDLEWVEQGYEGWWAGCACGWVTTRQHDVGQAQAVWRDHAGRPSAEGQRCRANPVTPSLQRPAGMMSSAGKTAARIDPSDCRRSR
jgi:hypothetical protein